MKLKVLTAALLISATSVANAGFFDSLFGGKEEAPAAVATPAVKAESSSTMGAMTDMAVGLLPTITQQLGVTDNQAEGGLGSLMQLAKGALSNDEFSQLSSGVPNMSSLLAAVPQLTSTEGEGGMADMLASAGGVASSLGGIAQLSKQFEALGLGSDMIAKFANIAITYFSSTGGTGTGALLQKGLSSILG